MMRHSSYLEIDLKILGSNVEKIKKLSGKAIPLPMVKANAYGNGIVPVARYLVQELGIKKIGVATLGEAIEIFKECPGLDTEIIVFSDTEVHDDKLREAYHNFKMTPLLQHRSDLESVLNDSQLKNLPLMIKFNSGMNRLGFTLDELAEIAPRLKGRGVKHLISHFATSFYVKKDADKVDRQYEEFRKAKKLLSDAGVSVEETSIANSGAIEQKIGTEETYTRPGLMLYGPPSVSPQIWDGKQISRLVTKVIKTFPIKKGTPAGYGINVAGEHGFMIVIALGYGDGFMTFMSGVELIINGHNGKVFGRVNMDLAYIIFDPSVEGKIKVDDVVEIWGHNDHKITDIADQMKTHAYQVMCGITSRIPRVYKE